MNSVKVISPEVIQILVESPVSFLSLGGLEEISPEVATSLSGFRGSFLKLDGLTDLSAEVAAILARFPETSGNLVAGHFAVLASSGHEARPPVVDFAASCRDGLALSC